MITGLESADVFRTEQPEACAEWCCPDREPQEHALQPTCYTCGKPMGRGL